MSLGGVSHSHSSAVLGTPGGASGQHQLRGTPGGVLCKSLGGAVVQAGQERARAGRGKRTSQTVYPSAWHSRMLRAGSDTQPVSGGNVSGSRT